MSTTGYIYRLFEATSDRVRDAVRAYVNIPCWTFGGASLWDVRPDEGRANLRPITRLEDIALLDVSGDFGTHSPPRPRCAGNDWMATPTTCSS